MKNGQIFGRVSMIGRIPVKYSCESNEFNGCSLELPFHPLTHLRDGNGNGNGSSSNNRIMNSIYLLISLHNRQYSRQSWQKSWIVICWMQIMNKNRFDFTIAMHFENCSCSQIQTIFTLIFSYNSFVCDQVTITIIIFFLWFNSTNSKLSSGHLSLSMFCCSISFLAKSLKLLWLEWIFKYF